MPRAAAAAALVVLGRGAACLLVLAAALVLLGVTTIVQTMMMVALGMTVICIRIAVFHANALDIILMILSTSSAPAVIAVLRAETSLVLTSKGNR